MRKLDLLKFAAMAFVIAVNVFAAKTEGNEPLFSLRGELVLSPEAGAVGGVFEGGAFLAKRPLFWSIEGGGGARYFGGLANFGFWRDNSKGNWRNAFGLSAGYRNVLVKTDITARFQGTAQDTVIRTVNQDNLSFGGAFWKMNLGQKRHKFDITNRFLFGTYTDYTFAFGQGQDWLKEDSKFNFTYALSAGIAFGRRKTEPEPVIIPEPEPVVEIVVTPTFTVRVTPPSREEGSIVPTGSITVEEGQDLALRINVNSGFLLEEFLVNQQAVNLDGDGPVYEHTLRNVTADMSVEARFDRVPVIEISRVAQVQKGINFETGTADLTPDSRRTLAALHLVMTENPDTRLEIAGHTDITGQRSTNMELSRARAQAVVDFLVGQGIEANRLVAVGHGPDRPVASNETEEGRAQNRRVEIRTID